MLSSWAILFKTDSVRLLGTTPTLKKQRKQTYCAKYAHTCTKEWQGKESNVVLS